MAEPRSFLSRARPLVLARAFSACVTFFIPLALARQLELAEYGTFKQFFLLSHTLYFALALGVPQSLFYFLPRSGGGERRAYLGQAILWLAAMGALVALFLTFTESVALQVGGPELAELRKPMGLYAGLLLASAAFEIGLTSQGRTGAAAAVYMVSDVVKTAAYLLPALLGYGLEGVLWCAAAFAGLRALACWIVFGVATAGQGEIATTALFREQLRYALPFGGAMLLAMPQQQFHQYVVSAASSPEIFALYAVGCFNLPVIDLLYTPTSELLMYRIGELERQGLPGSEAAAAFREAAGKLAYAFLPLAAGLFAIAPAFISLLYTEKFVGAAPIFRVALATVILSCFPVDGALRAKARTRTLLVSYGAKIGLTLPLVLGLFHALGPIGAMVGYAVTEAIHKSLLLVLASRALAPELASGGGVAGTMRALRATVPWRHFARAGGAAVGAAALALTTAGLLPLEPLLVVLVVGSLFWLAYFAALILAGVRPAALLAVFRPRG